jgi:molybdopterin molybdotransferase
VTPAEALRAILAATPVLGAETVAARDALGRVLAEAVVSRRQLPPSDNSAMDGYALRVADCTGADEPVALAVVFEVAAGGAALRCLEAGEAARIFTGAPIPPGADTVVRQEDTTRDGDRVLVQVLPRRGDHIRAAGEDVGCGDPVFEPGACLGPAHLGMLASLGRGVVAVHQRPRVAILSGGDELVEPDGEISGGRIVSSNSYSISAQCLELGADPVYGGSRATPRTISNVICARDSVPTSWFRPRASRWATTTTSGTFSRRSDAPGASGA